MICPTCRAEGATSLVYAGMSTRTGSYCAPFFDEQGHHHLHDSNITTQGFSYSRGHEWTETTGARPCWCGWPGERKAT